MKSWLLLLLLVAAEKGWAKPINEGDLLADAFSSDCLDWCITGACIWLDCGLTGCKLRTRLRVRHGYPDLVVSVYSQPGEVTFNRLPVLSLGHVEGGGLATNEASASGRDTQVMFKEVAIIGSPVPSILSRIPLMCPARTQAYQPYYQSETDAVMWRNGFIEALLYLWRLDQVGDPPRHTWAKLYPRYGFVNQQDEAHAAGVAAVRAMDIVKQPGQPHIYRSFQESGTVHNKSKTKIYSHPEPWQRISPNGSSRCELIGQDNSVGWSQQVKEADGQNAWHYWHTWECCLDAKGKVIAYFSTGAC